MCDVAKQQQQGLSLHSAANLPAMRKRGGLQQTKRSGWCKGGNCVSQKVVQRHRQWPPSSADAQSTETRLPLQPEYTPKYVPQHPTRACHVENETDVHCVSASRSRDLAPESNKSIFLQLSYVYVLPMFSAACSVRIGTPLCLRHLLPPLCAVEPKVFSIAPANHSVDFPATFPSLLSHHPVFLTPLSHTCRLWG